MTGFFASHALARSPAPGGGGLDGMLSAVANWPADATLVAALRWSTFNLVEAHAAWEGASVRHEVVPPDEGGGAFLCSFERRFAGLGSRHHHGAIVALHPADARDLAQVACRYLLKAGSFDQAIFRVSLPAGWNGPVREEVSHGQFYASLETMALQEVLVLPETMAAFERGLGRSTRRNVRKSRTRAATDQLRCTITHGAPPVDRVAIRSLAQNSMPRAIDVDEYEAISRFHPNHGKTFQVTVRSPNGDLAAVAGGVCEDEVATVLYQLNDRRYRANSPSLLLRSFLVEKLIERKIRSIVFSGACMGTLRRYCTPVMGGELFVQRRGAIPRLKRRVQALRLSLNRVSG